MPPSEYYSNVRTPNTHRHEIFFGPYRQKSIKLGLVVFLTPQQHNVGLYGVHCCYGDEFNSLLKQLGQTEYEKQIGTREQFIKEFGQNYLN